MSSLMKYLNQQWTRREGEENYGEAPLVPLVQVFLKKESYVTKVQPYRLKGEAFPKNASSLSTQIDNCLQFLHLLKYHPHHSSQ